MDINDVIIFLKKLDLENQNLKIKIKELEEENNKLKSDIGNLSKVSMISNMDKQIKEKIANIEILERQLEKANRLNSELQKKIDPEPEPEYETITYKKIDYYLDEDGNVYTMDTKQKVATYINNKFRFVK
jgi:DNA repair exonuclease SbcCD ATPase subunit